MMKKLLFFPVMFCGIGLLSCSRHSQKTEETSMIEEQDIECLCCLEEAPSDSIFKEEPVK